MATNTLRHRTPSKDAVAPASSTRLRPTATRAGKKSATNAKESRVIAASGKASTVGSQKTDKNKSASRMKKAQSTKSESPARGDRTPAKQREKKARKPQPSLSLRDLIPGPLPTQTTEPQQSAIPRKIRL